MNINLIGVFAAITTILTIWFGHVMVRKLESRLVRIAPAIFICFFLGIVCLGGSVLMDSNLSAALLGIMGFTFLWDALEFVRQQKRVKIGHAPSNPVNPRHLKILAENSTATTLDILDRNPRAEPYSPAEIQAILSVTSISESKTT